MCDCLLLKLHKYWLFIGLKAKVLLLVNSMESPLSRFASIKMSIPALFTAFVIIHHHLFLALIGGSYYCWAKNYWKIENENERDYGRGYVNLYVILVSVESAEMLHHIPASYDFMSKEQATAQSEFLGDCLRLLSHTFTTLQPLPVSQHLRPFK